MDQCPNRSCCSSVTFKMLLVVSILVTVSHAAWGSSSDKVKLTDVQVLTLYQGRMTTARRTYPVPQLKCVGGSAGCSAFAPHVVQCTNKGSDGFDVQWECKTDMDNAYRFGTIDVFCEGYDYPADPYVLQGSCGLEYTIDLTKEGGHKKNNGYNSYGSDYSSGKSSTLGTFIMLAIAALLAYAFYQTCLANRQYQYSSMDDGSDPGHQGRGGFGGFGGSSGPPPPGFRPEYMGGDNGNSGCGGTTNSGYGGSSGAGGFWTGAATGGILGYLFGRNNGYGNTGYGYRQPYYHRPSAPSWDGWGSSSFDSGGGSSSGTRSASGYGGTRRR